MSDLIEPDELAGWLASGRLAVPGEVEQPTDLAPAVLDVRWQLNQPSCYPAYLDAHIPGARWVDLDLELCDPPGARGRHPLPSPERLQQTLDRVGIADGQPAVVYDDADSVAAARAWWTLRWAGMSDVRVLNGGLGAWVARGLAVESGPVESGPVESGLEGAVGPPAVPFQARPGALPVLDADGAAALGVSGHLVDARARVRYLGDEEPVDAVAGRIPGARNIPTSGDVDGSGRFLAPDALRARFSALAGRSGPIGVYCGSGVTAAHSLLAMRLAGIDAVLYPGSWSEWITDPNRPVERGEPPAP